MESMLLATMTWFWCSWWPCCEKRLGIWLNTEWLVDWVCSGKVYGWVFLKWVFSGNMGLGWNLGNPASQLGFTCWPGLSSWSLVERSIAHCCSSAWRNNHGDQLLLKELEKGPHKLPNMVATESLRRFESFQEFEVIWATSHSFVGSSGLSHQLEPIFGLLSFKFR